MPEKEATARIKINRLLEAAGWRFFPEAAGLPAIKHYFKAYIIDSREYTDLATHPVLPTRDFRAVPPEYRTLVPEYVTDYVPFNQFTA